MPADRGAAHERPQGMRIESAPGEAAILVTCHEMYRCAAVGLLDGDVDPGLFRSVCGFPVRL